MDCFRCHGDRWIIDLTTGQRVPCPYCKYLPIQNLQIFLKQSLNFTLLPVLKFICI